MTDTHAKTGSTESMRVEDNTTHAWALYTTGVITIICAGAIGVNAYITGGDSSTFWMSFCAVVWSATAMKGYRRERRYQKLLQELVDGETNN